MTVAGSDADLDSEYNSLLQVENGLERVGGRDHHPTAPTGSREQR